MANLLQLQEEKQSLQLELEETRKRTAEAGRKMLNAPTYDERMDWRQQFVDNKMQERRLSGKLVRKAREVLKAKGVTRRGK